jgi:exodeoxyribonuclease V alpha subunit
VPVVRLTEVFRQAAQSRIIISAHRINQGSIPDLRPPLEDSDFYFVQADDPDAAVSRIIELVTTRIPKRFDLDPMDLPRFRGEVRSWDQGIWFDGILSSSFE